MEELPGGFVTRVVRVGDTVRRAAPPTRFVQDLLHHLESHGWAGAPRHLGSDEQGREVLGFLPGHVAWEPSQPPAVTSDDSLAGVARLLREFHDLTAGTPLAGAQEVVCHNDLSPKNTVFDGNLRPYAFIDWDLAAPGARLHDVAHVCWQFIPLGPPTAIPDAHRRLRVVTHAYGLTSSTADLIDTVLWWQTRCATGIATAAAAGDPAMQHLRDTGVIDEVWAAHRWTTEHRAGLI